MSLDTERTSAAAAPLRPHDGAAAGAPKATGRMKERRRPLLFALMAALVAAGALGSAYAYTSVNDTHEVLVLANDVARGEVIDAEDLKVVRVSVDPALTPVSSRERPSIEGRRAAMDLWSGTLLTEQAFTENLVPPEGQSLVGINLTPAQMPAEPLYAGDTVRIVSTPGEQGEISAESPEAIEATVVGVSRIEETGATVVDVSVTRANSADLAARAATGRVALVLDSRER